MTQPIDPTATDPPLPAPLPTTSPADSQVTDLASTIQNMINSSLAGAQKAIKGVVTAHNPTAAPPNVSLTLSGDTNVVDGVRYIDSYSPVVGDTVLVEKQGPDIFVLGQMNDTSAGAANGWQAPTLGSGFTTNGNSNGIVQYRLIVDNGDLVVQWRGSVSVTGTPTALCTLPAGVRPSVKRSLILARDPDGGSNVVGCDFNTDGTVTLTGTTTFGNVNGGSTGAASPGGTTGSGGADTVGSGSDPAGNTGSTDIGDSASTTPGATGSAAAHSHGINTSLDGYLSQAGSNLIHSHIGNDGTDTGGGATNTGGSHTHTSAAHIHTLSGLHSHTLGAGTHTHTQPSHTHSLTTTSHTHSFTPTGAVAAPIWVSFNGIRYFL